LDSLRADTVHAHAGGVGRLPRVVDGHDSSRAALGRRSDLSGTARCADERSLATAASVSECAGSYCGRVEEG